MDIAITRMSSKGQVVIPSDMRRDLPVGEKLVLIKDGHNFILKRIKDLAKDLRDDLAFAKRTEAALKRYDKNLFKTVNKEDFLDELDKW